jgi:aspartyl-tRNA(Asn)/glutamyl-tRNA(Gln) amidotransferase subunit B
MSKEQTEAAEALETLKEKYEPVIGLEVHVQLLTRSKIFCACSTRFGDPPNTNTCPVCLGMPGALPVLNREAVAKAVKAALALNCRVNRLSRFARKNYFYPDLPKGYQISQFDQPLAEHGWIMIRVEDGSEGPKGPEENSEKRIGITRLHLEEDAGKSIHDGYPDSNEKTYVDLNRSGVPLAEIVSEPDLRSPEEAYDYVTRLKQILLYLGVSDCNMEEGSLRCDANVSVRPRGQRELGVKTEVKNLNSFRFLQKALEYEIGRQVQVLEGGGRIEQETRLWNTQSQRTVGMRSKEHAHDYRYFPEPDLLPLIVSEELQEEIRRTIPELPDAKRRRFVERYKLSEYDAEVLTATQELAGYYEQVAVKASDPKQAANWVMVELLGALNAAGRTLAESLVSPEALGGLLALIEDGTVSGKMAKSVFEQMFAAGKSARQIVDELGLKQITDDSQIREIIRKAIAGNPKQLEQYRAGKTTLFGFFVGQVMKETKGQANPQKVNELLKEELGKG